MKTQTKQLGMTIDLNRCTGCKTCIVACRNYHELVDPAQAMPNEMPYYLRVENHRFGTYPDIAVDTWVVPCQHCVEPECVAYCPEGAISKDPHTGIVCIDPETCTGCDAIPGAFGAEKPKTAPCMVECPAHINVQGYVALAAKGKFREALELIKEANPLPAITGRVCYHPCEPVCKRGEVDAPVGINDIKRFVADLDLNADEPYVPEIKEQKEDQVAIVGSGPAGLTCAHYLAHEGYQVTLFEKESVLGGMLTQGIPSYRLPRAVVEAEVGLIRDMGVTVKTGVEIGKDVTVAQLREQGFKAFFLAVGTQVCLELGVEGEDLEGVYPGLDYLRQVNLGEPVALGNRVAVIGGGNVAIDVVRSARRLGAEDAFILYRRSMEEMPARPEELDDCQAEGIPIDVLTQPLRFVGENGRVKAIECIKMRLTDELDDSGRPVPEPVPGSEFTIEVDAVITALGQETDWSCLTPECACTLTDWGTMDVDPLTFQSDDPDIFAGGDAIRGPDTVIGAIADGRQAAISIDRFIRGVDLRQGRDKAWVAVEDVQKEKYEPAGRADMPRLDVEKRGTTFDEVQQGLAEEAAVQEAQRCLGCGAVCIQACPYTVIQFNGEEGKAHKCDLCAYRVQRGELPVCAEVCLTDAIVFGEVALLKQHASEQAFSVVGDLSEESILYVK
jgi:NADPH-dependent glutamate synthase beta subunit-like oxidoreductase/Pyruvate/2-oxoacid:ferredoxin oxidoreductase delta subunit